MELDNKEVRGNTEGTGKQNNKMEDTYRITVSKAAEKALVEIWEKVNQDFSAGQVNRPQVASWVLIKFAENFNSEDLKAMRMDHIDEMSLLEHYYKKAKENGQVQPEVRDLLRKLAGIDEAQKRSSKGRLTRNVINDDIDKDGKS